MPTIAYKDFTDYLSRTAAADWPAVINRPERIALYGTAVMNKETKLHRVCIFILFRRRNTVNQRGWY